MSDEPSRWRTGRKNPHTIYEQPGDQPSDTDPFVGSLNSPEDTALAVDAVNAVRRVRKALDDAEWGGPERHDVIREIRAALEDSDAAAE